MMAERAGALSRIRLAAWIVAAIFLAAQLARYGIDLFVLVSSALVVLIGLTLQHIEERARQPLKSYLRWALASFALGLVLIALPLYLDANLFVGAILWLALSFAGLLWCVQYERTEPR